PAGRIPGAGRRDGAHAGERRGRGRDRGPGRRKRKAVAVIDRREAAETANSVDAEATRYPPDGDFSPGVRVPSFPPPSTRNSWRIGTRSPRTPIGCGSGW